MPKVSSIKITNKSDIYSNTLKVSLPRLKQEIPLFILFKALGVYQIKLSTISLIMINQIQTIYLLKYYIILLMKEKKLSLNPMQFIISANILIIFHII